MISVHFKYLVFSRKAILEEERRQKRKEEEATGVLGSFVLPHKVFLHLAFRFGQVRGEGLDFLQPDHHLGTGAPPPPTSSDLSPSDTFYICLHVYCLLPRGKCSPQDQGLYL